MFLIKGEKQVDWDFDKHIIPAFQHLRKITKMYIFILEEVGQTQSDHPPA